MLGENLKNLRKERNLTQKQVAQAIAVSQQTYAYYEKNTIQRKITTFNYIADYFGVSLDYLFGREKSCGAFPKPRQLDIENAELFERHVKVLQYQKSLLEARIEKSESYEEFKETLQQLVDIEKVIQDKISYIQKLQECTINELG